MTEKKYHIYANEKRIYSDLPEDEFNKTWTMIQNLLSIMESNVRKEDLKYEEVVG